MTTTTAPTIPGRGFWPLARCGRSFSTDDLALRYGHGARLAVAVEVSCLNDGKTQPPHFSVTGEVTTTRSRMRRDIEAAGCLHDEALHYWPECAPLVALHLSSAKDGSPMHAIENGWYWAAGALGGLGQKYHGGNGQPAKTAADCLAVFAAHIRRPIDEARSVLARLECGPGGEIDRDPETMRLRFRVEMADMRDRWAMEARAGVAWIVENAADDLRAEWLQRLAAYLGYSQ